MQGMVKTRSLAARTALQAAVLLGAVGWVFAPAWHGQWLWDDGLEVSENPLLRDPAGWWKAWTGPAGLDYLPLKSSLQWVEWRLWGGDLLGYHLANIALHAMGALLLWRLLVKLASGGGVPPPASPAEAAGRRFYSVTWAWVGAMIFALHPMAVESVAWISEFKNVVSLPPLLASLLLFLGWVDGERGAPWRYWGAVLCFALAMLCKSSAVAIPLFLPVLIWWRTGRLSFRRVWALLPFLAVSLGMGLATLHFQWHRAMGLEGVPNIRLGGEAIASNLLEYIETALYPRRLAPVYAPVAWPWAPAVVLVLLAAAAACWRMKRARWGPPALLASSGFVLNLLPVLGFIPMAYLRVSPRADHLAYLSLAAFAGGWAALLGALYTGGAQGPPAPGGRRIAHAAIGAVTVTGLAGCALVSHAYAGAFRNETSLWSLAVRRQPGAWEARANWGQVLLKQGRWEAAEAQLRAAAGLQPRSAEVRTYLGDALQHLDQPEAALAEYRAAVQIAPDFAAAHYHLGRALLVAGEPAAAAEEFRAALRLDPGYAVAHNNLGLALMHLGETARAVAEYRLALDEDPALAEAHLNLGNAYFNQGDAERAASEYRAALQSYPGYRAAHLNLSRALIALGRDEEARAELNAANREQD